MTNQPAFPLSWPIGWPRTAHHRVERARFDAHSMMRASDEVLAQLQRLGGRDVVISTNVELRLDGLPRSGQKKPNDCGAAVYFKLKGRDQVLACDKWDSVEHNLWAIAKHIEAMRGQIRWGVGTVEQAFQGYAALPSGTPLKPWREVLGLMGQVNAEQVSNAYRELARRFHPDIGGTEGQMRELNAARDAALKEVTR
jgi:hypothetical protein